MSVYQVVGAIAGAIVGYVSESPQAGFATYAAIAGVGAYLDQPNRQGPRLEDLRSQLSTYGNNIPFCYGTNRFAGTVIWPSIIEAEEHEHSESTKGGPDNVTFTYTLSFAVLVCEGPIDGIRRIWANKKLVYDVSTGNEGAIQDPAISQVRFYLGSDAQEPDPLIEAREGPSPAYLDYAYVVFEDYDVTELNGRVPQFEFEVVTDGLNPEVDATDMGAAGNEADIDPSTEFVWSVDGTPNTQLDVYITDVRNEALVEHLEIVPSDTSASMGSDITFVEGLGEFWVANENGTTIIAINAVTYTYRELSFPIGWSGLVHYCPENGNIVIGTTNIGGNLYVLDPTGTSIQATLTITGSVFAVDQVVTLENGQEAALADGTVAICNISGATSNIAHQYTDALVGSTAYMAADPSRNRLVILNESDTSLIELNLDTGTFTEHELDFPDDLDPGASTALHRIEWHGQIDKYLVTAHQSGLGWTLYVINPTDWSIETARVYVGPTGTGTIIEVPNRTSYFVYVDGATNKAWKIPLLGAIDPNQVVLADIVTDLCLRTGLTAGEIDVTDLEDDLVDGFLVGRQMTSRSAIEPLQTAYNFDSVESGRKIKFVKRGGPTVTTIPLDDRAAHSSGQDMPAHLDIVRAFEYELPFQCDVEYADINADHLVGNQYDRRITKDTRQRINIQLPIAMAAEKAKQIARIALYDAWKKLTFKFSTTVKYAFLEPTDLVYLPTDTTTYLAMITNRRDQPNGIIEWEARIEDLDSYTQSGDDAVPIPYTPQTIFEPSDTILELMDAPILRDQDADDGFCVAMGGETTSWRGGQLFRSEDGGSTYTSVLSAVNASTIGTATDALANFTGGDVFDEGSSVTVVIETGQTLTNYTEAQVMSGAGGFLLGENRRWEVLQYKTATLVGENTYTLTGLLRGRRGTEWAMSTHEAGDRFIFGNVDTWRLYNPPSSDLNVERFYKAPAFRSKLVDAPTEAFTDRAIRRRPYSVAHLKAEPLNDGGYTVSWVHRSLVGSSWASGLSVPLDTNFTAFSVTISAVDGSVVREFTTIDEAFPYSASDIEDDFGAIPPNILIRVAQRNSDYGDGVGTTLRTEDMSILYDFSDPLSDPYVPPDTTTPPEPPEAGTPVPPGNQWFGSDYWAPALWDGTYFIASNVYEKAVISSGKLWTSTDGLNYTQLSANNMTIPLGIAAYHGGVYVNQWESSKPWYSADLQAWTEGVFGPYPSGYPYDSQSPFSKIIHDGTRFVAARRNGEIVSSSSGATWDHQCNVTTPTDTSGYFAGNGLEAWGFAYGAGVYVAVGLNPSGGASLSDRIWTSANFDGPYSAQDGAPIVDHGGGPIDKAYLYSVTFNVDDGYFYACGAKRYYFEPSGYYVSTGVIIRSADGETWDDVTPTPVVAPTYTGNLAYSFHKVTGGYVVIGTNAYWTSADGATWTEHALIPYNENQLLSLNVGVSNGAILATQERQWLFRDEMSAGQLFTYSDQYRKPITFDGSAFDPTLDSPYP